MLQVTDLMLNVVKKVVKNGCDESNVEDGAD